MDQTEQTIHPAVLTAAEPAFGPGWLLLARTPKGPSEERVLGTRAVLISLVGATTGQLQKAANEMLDLFDRDAASFLAVHTTLNAYQLDQQLTHPSHRWTLWLI